MVHILGILGTINTKLFFKFLQVGRLTSYTTGRKESDHFALGYIKRQAASGGDTVIVGENIIGTVVDVPFLSRQSPPIKNSNP